MEIPTDDQVRQFIAQHISALAGLAPEQVLAGTPFVELDSNFDSLALLEVQLELEDRFGFEFDREMMSAAGRLPQDVGELAQAVLEHHQAFHARKNQDGTPLNTSQPA